MKAVVAAFNQEKALVGAFSVITNLRMELFEAQVASCGDTAQAQSELSSPLYIVLRAAPVRRTVAATRLHGAHGDSPVRKNQFKIWCIIEY